MVVDALAATALNPPAPMCSRTNDVRPPRIVEVRSILCNTSQINGYQSR